MVYISRGGGSVYGNLDASDRAFIIRVASGYCVAEGVSKEGKRKGDEVMLYNALYRLMCSAYGMILRDLLKKAVEDPDEEWDDWTLNLLDKLFDYKESK